MCSEDALPTPFPQTRIISLELCKFFMNTAHESNAAMLYESLFPSLGKDHLG